MNPKEKFELTVSAASWQSGSLKKNYLNVLHERLFAELHSQSQI